MDHECSLARGAYYWQKAYALLETCGSRSGPQLNSQRLRIISGRFPSALLRYRHLELGPSCSLASPSAATFQQQLEEKAGTKFAGARAPPRRLKVKSACVRFAEFPRSLSSPEACRAQLRQSYGLSECLLARCLLARLVEMERIKTEQKAA